MDKEQIVRPTKIMEQEYDWYRQEFTGNTVPTKHETYEDLYRCGACEKEIFIDNYCSNCGQRLR